MQTSKGRTSPATPRKLKVPASDSDSVPSPNQTSRTPKDKSPKVVQRRSPRSPVAEKKRPTKVSELESQLSLLQEELKNTKEQLSSSESCKKQLEQELAATSAKLDGAQKQLTELSASEQELAAMSAKLEEAREQLTEFSASKEALQNQHSSDLNGLRSELAETLNLVDKLKSELIDRERSESRTSELVTESQVELEMLKTIEETLRAENLKATEELKSVTFELEKSKARGNGENGGSGELEAELFEVKNEVNRLKSVLDLSERRCQEENIQSTLLIRSAYEKAEHLKSELEKSKAEIEELKAVIASKEIQSVVEETTIETELKKLRNEKEEALALVESARASEREALMKIGYLTEEVDKSTRKAARVFEQLEAVQVSNGEMEAELRKLKVQSDQWRKAAEAAAAMISSGHNGKFVERTGSLDKGGYNTIGAKLGSPFSEDMDEESPKKKNNNMLKKIGIFRKKSQK